MNTAPERMSVEELDYVESLPGLTLVYDRDDGSYDLEPGRLRRILALARRAIDLDQDNVLPPPPSMAAQSEEMEAIAQLREGVIARYPTILARLADSPPPDAPASGECKCVAGKLNEAVKRYEKCRDDRPLVYTMAHDDPLTVGDVRQAAALLEAQSKEIERLEAVNLKQSVAVAEKLSELQELASLRETVGRYERGIKQIIKQEMAVAGAKHEGPSATERLARSLHAAVPFVELQREIEKDREDR